MSDESRVIGRRIRDVRLEQGWTQHELGSRLHISHAAVSDLERGVTHLTPERVAEIATVLGVPNPFLYGFQFGSDSDSATGYRREEIKRILSDLQAWASGMLQALEAAQARIRELEGSQASGTPSEGR